MAISDRITSLSERVRTGFFMDMAFSPFALPPGARLRAAICAAARERAKAGAGHQFLDEPKGVRLRQSHSSNQQDARAPIHKQLNSFADAEASITTGRLPNA